MHSEYSTHSTRLGFRQTEPHPKNYLHRELYTKMMNMRGKVCSCRIYRHVQPQERRYDTKHASTDLCISYRHLLEQARCLARDRKRRPAPVILTCNSMPFCDRDTFIWSTVGWYSKGSSARTGEPFNGIGGQSSRLQGMLWKDGWIHYIGL